MTSPRLRTPTPKATVLICEDEAPLRELMKVSLDDDYRVLEASDGEEALRLARAHNPDVVILDLMVPGVSGLEVLRELRDDPATKHTRVVVVSAWTDVEARSLAAGADGFVAKPFEPEEFSERIREMLSPP